MTTEITIQSTEKAGIYEEIIPQLRALLGDEQDLIANLSNTSAVLKAAFLQISWVGFYLFDGHELLLGPFQGKPACVRIRPGRGVCGTSFSRRETVIVPDVNEFPDHIACDAGSRSEIVVPLQKAHTCYGVLDVDSYDLNAFDEVDRNYLETIALLLLPYFAERPQHGQ